METFLLVFAGGALACLLSVALTRFLLILFNAGQRYASLTVAPDTSVILYTFGACAVTAVVAGLYPAWQASRTNASPGLKGEALHGGRRSLVRRSLIVVQVALAVVLLFGASLFTHSLRKLKTVDLGYDIDHLLSAEIGTRQAPKDGPAPPHSTLADALTAVRQLPLVESAAISNLGVLSGMKMSGDITARETAGKANASFLSVGPGYFRTMRIPLFGGRDFQASDRKGSPPVAVINQRLAFLLSPDRSPVGQHFEGWGEKSIEIIGVTGNSKYADVREDTTPVVYLAFDQEGQEQGWGVLEIRCRASLAATERAVRESITTATPGLEIYRATAMELMRDNTIAQDRLLAFLSSLFGTLGTVLALVGIYGLISYSVTRRTREIGIRMSIGAQPSDVLWLFLRESTLLVAGGLLIGLPLALVLARFLRTMLFGVTASEPLDISVTLALLVLGGLLASIIPARRATRVNPVQALRYD
jgi:predicted permease